MVPVKVGGDSRASNEPLAGYASIHGNSARSNHPPDTATLTKSVEIPTQYIYLTNSPMREGRVGRKSRTNVQFGTQNKLSNLTRQEWTTHGI